MNVHAMARALEAQGVSAGQSAILAPVHEAGRATLAAPQTPARWLRWVAEDSYRSPLWEMGGEMGDGERPSAARVGQWVSRLARNERVPRPTAAALGLQASRRYRQLEHEMGATVVGYDLREQRR